VVEVERGIETAEFEDGKKLSAQKTDLTFPYSILLLGEFSNFAA
jgi:hypothetical protein